MARRSGSGLLSIALAAIASAGCSPGDVSAPCTPGRQIACACGGGRQGYQTCRGDGSGYGVCTGCNDAGAVSRPDGSPSGGDASPGDGATDTAPDSGGSSADSAVSALDASTAADSAGPSYAWVWIDRGGPAFQPHACRAGAGVVDGMLVDPRAFFSALVAGRDPNTWPRVMNDIESELWSCGVGQQRGSGGDVRGRLFLPTAACPDASPPPGDTTAMHLGVRQEPDCWSHAVDVVGMM